MNSIQRKRLEEAGPDLIPALVRHAMTARSAVLYGAGGPDLPTVIAELEAIRALAETLEDVIELGSSSEQWEKSGKATAILPDYEKRTVKT